MEIDIQKEKKAIKNLKASYMEDWDLTEDQKDDLDALVYRVLMVGKEEGKQQATPEGFVLVPKDQITCFWQDNDEPENFCNSPSDFDSLGDCIDLGDIMQINKHTQANIGTEKLYGTWVADAGNPLERSRSKFFVGTESECKEIVLENERVFEEAQEQDHE